MDYEAELESVCATMLGKAMYEWAKAKVVNEKVKIIMNELSGELDDLARLDHESAVMVCNNVRQKVSAVANLELLDQKRTVMFPYRGRPS